MTVAWFHNPEMQGWGIHRLGGGHHTHPSLQLFAHRTGILQACLNPYEHPVSPSCQINSSLAYSLREPFLKHVSTPSRNAVDRHTRSS